MSREQLGHRNAPTRHGVGQVERVGDGVDVRIAGGPVDGRGASLRVEHEHRYGARPEPVERLLLDLAEAGDAATDMPTRLSRGAAGSECVVDLVDVESSRIELRCIR
jgi:hypothetical protein